MANTGEQLCQKYPPRFAGKHLSMLVLAVVTWASVSVGVGQAESCTANPREKECNVGCCGRTGG